jgi:hypothetical protein
MFMIDKIWEYRVRLYTALLIGIAIFAAYSYAQSLQEPKDSQFIKDFRKLNASFCPPDIVPHPNLPEPNYPDPRDQDKPKDPNDPKTWGDLV